MNQGAGQRVFANLQRFVGRPTGQLLEVMQGQSFGIIIGLRAQIKPFDSAIQPRFAQMHPHPLGQGQGHLACTQAFQLRVAGRLDQSLRHRARQSRKIPFDDLGFRCQGLVETRIQLLEYLTLVLPRIVAQLSGQGARRCWRSRQLVAQQRFGLGFGQGGQYGIQQLALLKHGCRQVDMRGARPPSTAVLRQAIAHLVDHGQPLALRPARQPGQQLQLQIGPTPGGVLTTAHLLDKCIELVVDHKALEGDVQQGRCWQIVQMDTAHDIRVGAGQLTHLLQGLLVKGCGFRPQAPQ